MKAFILAICLLPSLAGADLITDAVRMFRVNEYNIERVLRIGSKAKGEVLCVWMVNGNVLAKTLGEPSSRRKRYNDTHVQSNFDRDAISREEEAGWERERREWEKRQEIRDEALEELPLLSIDQYLKEIDEIIAKEKWHKKDSNSSFTIEEQRLCDIYTNLSRHDDLEGNKAQVYDGILRGTKSMVRRNFLDITLETMMLSRIDAGRYKRETMGELQAINPLIKVWDTVTMGLAN
jgi:hypothetical protein